MLRLILATAITLAAAVPATGQSLRVIGAVGGAATTMTGDIEGEIDFANGLAAMAGVDWTIAGPIGLQARAGYIQKGFRGSDQDDALGSVEGWAALSYAEFGALGRIGNGPLHVLLGASAGVPVSCEIGGRIEGISFAVDCSEEDIDLAIDIGLTGGIGVAVWKGMFANLLFTEGLQDAGEDIEGRNRALSLTIGASFPGR